MYKGDNVYRQFYGITKSNLVDLMFNAYLEGMRQGHAKGMDGRVGDFQAEARRYVMNLEHGVFGDEVEHD
jgi:hypothetical protein